MYASAWSLGQCCYLIFGEIALFFLNSLATMSTSSVGAMPCKKGLHPTLHLAPPITVTPTMATPISVEIIHTVSTVFGLR